MCIAGLILDYITVLLWPAIVVFLLVKYGPHIDRLLGRIAEESEEISFPFLGLTMKLGKEIQEFASRLGPGESETKDFLAKAVHRAQLREFRVVCSRFYGHPYAVRVEAAALAASLAGELPLKDLLGFSTSDVPWERFGGAIGLRARIESEPSIGQDKAVVIAIRALLHDVDSRVRYRAVLAAGASPYLVGTLCDDLTQIMESGSNKPTRTAARRALARAK